jgi:peptidoglycan/LPS O-acetylase OafA/YrhL
MTAVPSLSSAEHSVEGGDATRIEATDASRTLRDVAGLDGIRGLAVAAVFCFHAGLPWAPGGFLGVSVFFTLSGFLITSLLIEEAHTTGGVDLGRFWARRVRRLVPAALATVAGVLVLAAFAWHLQPATLRADTLSALANVANWHFLAAGRSYADLFQAPSPLLHFWSLAIEEQFYLLFPIAVWLVVRTSRTPRQSRRRLRRLLVGGVLVSGAVTLIAAHVGATTFVYYSLPTRAAELLLGALLATALRPRVNRPALTGPWPSIVGGVALVLVAWLVATTSVTSSWVEHGGLILFPALSAAVIVSALGRGPVSALLSWSPLQKLGRISYGVYLYSWPIILWLTPARVGTHGAPLIVVQAAVTLAVASASYRWLEMPIRQGRALRGRSTWIALPIAVSVAAMTVFLVTATLPAPASVNLVSAQVALKRRLQQSAALRVDAVSRGPRVAFYGDSTALVLGLGVISWSMAHGAPIVSVDGSVGLGCGITRGGQVRFEGTVRPARSDCGDWAQTWPAALVASRPDVAVVEVGPFDVADRLLAGDSQWRAPGDPIYDAYLHSEMLQAADVFLTRGIRLVWLTSPDIDDQVALPPGVTGPENDPARMARFNMILRTVAAERPGSTVVDLSAWVRSWPGGPFDPALRPDGVHFSTDSATADAAPWLVPLLLRADGLRMPRTASPRPARSSKGGYKLTVAR